LEKGVFMYYQKRHSILVGLILLIFGFAIILGVLLWLDLHRPWQWPMVFGVIWFLIIIFGPILIILGIRFLILGYFEKIHFPIPPRPVYPGVTAEAPIQIKPQARHCPKCRRQIPLDSEYCAYCGDEL
jgi:hypothetical protein